jgi:hypothetical protein
MPGNCPCHEGSKFSCLFTYARQMLFTCAITETEEIWAIPLNRKEYEALCVLSVDCPELEHVDKTSNMAPWEQNNQYPICHIQKSSARQLTRT